MGKELGTHYFRASITALAAGGAFVGTVTEDIQSAAAPSIVGKKAFIRYACPGEVVEAAIEQQSANLIEGKLLNVLNPSVDRTTPTCSIFGRCGGCDLQHLQISAQRRFKLDMIRGMFRKHASFDLQDTLVDMSESLPAYQYRSRCEFHLNQAGELGFYMIGSGDVVDCPECPLLTPPLNEFFKLYRHKIIALKHIVRAVRIEEEQGKVKLLLKIATDATNPLADPGLDDLCKAVPSIKILQDRKLIFERASEQAIDSTGHFSQVNQVGNAVLQRLVTSAVTGGQVTEFYAGSGNFTFPLADLHKRVVAIEADPALVEKAKQEARLRKLEDRISFHTSSCEKYIRKGEVLPSVLLDPPRSGAKLVCQALSSSKVREIAYVSCNLASFFRDFVILRSSGFELKRLNFVDMFPQTHHVELVGEFRAT